MEVQGQQEAPEAQAVQVIHQAQVHLKAIQVEQVIQTPVVAAEALVR